MLGWLLALYFNDPPHLRYREMCSAGGVQINLPMPTFIRQVDDSNQDCSELRLNLDKVIRYAPSTSSTMSTGGEFTEGYGIVFFYGGTTQYHFNYSSKAARDADLARIDDLTDC